MGNPKLETLLDAHHALIDFQTDRELARRELHKSFFEICRMLLAMPETRARREVHFAIKRVLDEEGADTSML